VVVEDEQARERAPRPETSARLDVAGLPEHVRENIRLWDEDAPNWVAMAERAWAEHEMSWGQWGAVGDDVALLPDDCTGLEVVDLGCGGGYVSGWAAMRGARRVLAVDTSLQQLSTARRLARKHGVDDVIEFVHASAEDVPAPDASFDHAFSEYGAATWCDPQAWVREAWRILRPGGRLSFLTNHHLVMVCSPADGSLPVSETLQVPWFGDHRFDWRDAVDEAGGIEYCYPAEDWIGLFLDIGFVVTGNATVQAPDDASGTPFAVTAEWARRYPSEVVWHVRRPD
jgi:SAM-dependent methyltransferase